ncbi:MAG: hypothetical protein LC104_19585 [Bacteroidales bacterium]|nr:hypothetical protein [Bacteroidales bacterium]
MNEILTILTSVCVLTAGVAADLQVTAQTTDVPASVAKEIQTKLDPNALTVRHADGDKLLTLWFRTVIPAEASPAQVRNGLTYREIPTGTLFAVVQFHTDFTDYRKQTVPAGVYTLRFAIQPDVGDHIGTTPHPEFALLSPIAKDTEPAIVDGKDLLKRSSTITDGDHPAVMLLFPHHGREAGAKIVDKGEGVWALLTRRAVDADGDKSSLGFALTIAGSSKSR